MKVLPQFSLSQKLVILVTLPLAVQFSLMLGLTKVQADAEKQLAEANLALNISDCVNHLNSNIYGLVTAYSDDKFMAAFSTNDKSFVEYRSHLDKNFADLRTLAKSKPDILESVAQAEKSADQVVADFLELKESLRLNDNVKDKANIVDRRERRAIWDKLRNHTLQAIDSELFANGEKERRLANKAPEIQANLRQVQQRLMIAAAIAGIFVAVAMAIILSKSITQRLTKMIQNTYLLASGEPLLPVQSGADDICRLDQFFHSMAGALEGARRKEGAFIDTANDVLLMIEPGGRITSINSACEERFGFSKEDLLGSHFIDLLLTADKKRALEYLDKLHGGIVQSPIELRMWLYDRTVADTLWSAQWSDEEKSFFCIIHDITGIREAERMKQEVVDMVTHDLKTPLVSLTDVLETLPRTPPENRAKYIVMARRSVNHMTNLVADLLDIEKAKAGMIKLAKEKIQLSECFDSALDSTAPLVEASKVRVSYQDPQVIVEADPEALTRVIINLVSNAIKFSPAGAEISIGAASGGGIIQIWVQDQGQGIPAAELERVFERFQQVSPRGGTKNDGGTGLGLAVCKEFVRLHGGKIWAESSEGKGSKFTFTLPETK